MQPFRTINTLDQLSHWCNAARGVEWIALDTEFIAEKYYQPLLCLIQAATPEGNFLIDPIAILDTTQFWNLLAEGEHVTIVHAGRVELEFCHRFTGKFPKHVFDTQLAAGLASTDYPAGYTNVVSHFLNMSMPGTESRTNWKCRPLTPRQVEYALDDILYLNLLRVELTTQLENMGRYSWLEGETQTHRAHLEEQLSEDRWQRMLGKGHWQPKELAIIQNLWYWRDGVARQRDCTARRVLRDDLILELAKRKAADESAIKNIRGMERDDLRYHIPDISARIRSALAMPEEECPHLRQTHHCAKLSVIGTLLFSILGTICHDCELAPGLVGTTSDVRDWVAWKLNLEEFDTPPLLATGWRAEIVGKRFEELLSGEKLIRIGNPLGESPIEFVSQFRY